MVLYNFDLIGAILITTGECYW